MTSLVIQAEFLALRANGLGTVDGDHWWDEGSVMEAGEPGVLEERELVVAVQEGSWKQLNTSFSADPLHTEEGGLRTTPICSMHW